MCLGWGGKKNATILNCQMADCNNHQVLAIPGVLSSLLQSNKSSRDTESEELTDSHRSS